MLSFDHECPLKRHRFLMRAGLLERFVSHIQRIPTRISLSWCLLEFLLKIGFIIPHLLRMGTGKAYKSSMTAQLVRQRMKEIAATELREFEENLSEAISSCETEIEESALTGLRSRNRELLAMHVDVLNLDVVPLVSAQEITSDSLPDSLKRFVQHFRENGFTIKLAIDGYSLHIYAAW